MQTQPTPTPDNALNVFLAIMTGGGGLLLLRMLEHRALIWKLFKSFAKFAVSQGVDEKKVLPEGYTNGNGKVALAKAEELSKRADSLEGDVKHLVERLDRFEVKIENKMDKQFDDFVDLSRQREDGWVIQMSKVMESMRNRDAELSIIRTDLDRVLKLLEDKAA